MGQKHRYLRQHRRVAAEEAKDSEDLVRLLRVLSFPK